MTDVRMTEREAARAGIGGKKRRKYGNEPCEMDGFKFDSLAEMTRYGELKLLERAGKISGLIADKKKLRYELRVNGILVCIYEADFSYYREGDKEIMHPVVEDTKGVRTAAFILKKKLMRAIYGIEIQEIG